MTAPRVHANYEIASEDLQIPWQGQTSRTPMLNFHIEWDFDDADSALAKLDHVVTELRRQINATKLEGN